MDVGMSVEEALQARGVTEQIEDETIHVVGLPVEQQAEIYRIAGLRFDALSSEYLRRKMPVAQQYAASVAAGLHAASLNLRELIQYLDDV